jgi:hypothetical protein
VGEETDPNPTPEPTPDPDPDPAPDTPSLSSDFTTGAPGSTFVITATGFPTSTAGIISIREPGSSDFRNLTGVTTDGEGRLIFVLATAESADSGTYTVRLTVADEPDDVSRTIDLTLAADSEVRTGTGGDGDPVVNVGPENDQQQRIYLPFVRR